MGNIFRAGAILRHIARLRELVITFCRVGGAVRASYILVEERAALPRRQGWNPGYERGKLLYATRINDEADDTMSSLRLSRCRLGLLAEPMPA